jgi:hypothetical protein
MALGSDGDLDVLRRRAENVEHRRSGFSLMLE